jgi:cell division septation protein DedD
LYVEAHPPLEESRAGATKAYRQLRQVITQALKGTPQPRPAIDWERVRQVITAGHGIPVAVSAGSPDPAKVIASAPEVSRLPGSTYAETPNVSARAWYVRAGSFAHASNARRLAAMIKHMGPAIPTQYVVSGTQHQVVAGPFKTKRQALTSAQRIRSSFGSEPVVMPPGT